MVDDELLTRADIVVELLNYLGVKLFLIMLKYTDLHQVIELTQLLQHVCLILKKQDRNRCQDLRHIKRVHYAETELEQVVLIKSISVIFENNDAD